MNGADRTSRRELTTGVAGEAIRRTCVAALVFATLLSVHSASAQDTVNAELHDLLPARIKASGVIRVGSPRTIPPQVFVKNGQLTGMAVDASRALEPILGVKFEWGDMQFPGIIPGLQSGAIDLSWGIVSYLPERAAILNMIPFNKGGSGVMVQPGVEGFSSSPMSMCGRRVAGVTGSNVTTLTNQTSAKCLAEGKAPIQHQVYANSGAALVAFQAGNVEGYVSTYTYLLDVNKNAGGKYTVYDFGDWPAPPSGIAVAKDELGLAKALEGGLQILLKNGTYHKILESYGMGATALPASQMTINP
ncbi:MAG: transporter substrate-binding domain-containing protein [Xanthobacteraceae bacterium]|nr:transporter substrate-binding domain-containing protein [Xanthobacteraceae bacterium]